MPRMDLRMERSVLLASSAISSSDKMQRRISSHNGVSGSIWSKNPVRESTGSSSVSSAETGRSGPVCPMLARENAFARLAASRREQTRKSSVMLKDAPISKRFRESRISCTPEKEMRPPLKRRFSASLVCNCKRLISLISVPGVRERQRFFASSLEACSAKRAMILLYSNVFKTFSFIRFIIPCG